jgi:hypothetical protein
VATFGTFTPGQVLTAAELNNGLLWTSFTPAFTNFTLGNGTVTAKYSIFGKVMFCKVAVTLGSTSTVGDPIRMTIPASATAVTTSQEVVGNAMATDAGVATYLGYVLLTSSTQVTGIVINAASTYGQANTFNTTRPFTWGNADQFRLDFMLELL